jgi:valine--pyruvate aminotransferase
MKFSKFGEKFTGTSGILQLMDDLGSAMAGNDDVIMLGGGNPSYIPQVQVYFRERMRDILENDRQFEKLVGNYGPPHGEREFARALASLLRSEYDWHVQPENIALTTGSQTAFFYIFNMLAGTFKDGSHKKILLPLAPEYIGYHDVGLVDDFFVASKPEFEHIDEHIFKYRVNFDAVSVTDQIGAICVSRPTNPTGNVLTDDEIEKLRNLARENDIPFIIDNAYGTPFPNIIFTSAQPVWDENIILCMSLSKLGLPGTRTGIIIANEQITAAISGLNAVTSLAPNNFGAVLALDLVKSGQIIKMSQAIIKPYYQQKAEYAVNQLHSEMKGFDFYIHKPEGAFFLWLWFKDLPVTSQELYERLKQRGVLVVPGQYFFPGIREAWRHKYECIRMSYAQDEVTVKAGIKIIAEEVKEVYST